MKAIKDANSKAYMYFLSTIIKDKKHIKLT